MLVNVSYPETPGVKLSKLYKHNCFIRSSGLYRDYTTVYMTLETPAGPPVKCLNFNDGNIEIIPCNTKVIEMFVEIKARPMTDKDREALPF